MWVFAGHSVNLAAAKLPIVDQPSMAVDVFILLSGFVMVYTARGSGMERAGLTGPGYRSFLLRRFFRLSPAFFVIFALALALAPWTGELREHLTALGSPAPREGRYADQGPLNIALHLSYLFGLLPEYASRSTIPDWSISLEMQFYAVFPLILALTTRHRAAGFLAILALAAALMLAFPAYFEAFSRPSPLPMKINLFLAGMLLADLVTHDDRPALKIALAMLLALVPSDGEFLAPRNLVRPFLVLPLALIILCEARRISGGPLRLLRWRPVNYLGEISYSVYLLHLALLVPIEAIIARETGLAGLTLAAISFAASAPIVLAGSSLLYHFVEKPGIRLGKRMFPGPATPRPLPAT